MDFAWHLVRKNGEQLNYEGCLVRSIETMHGFIVYSGTTLAYANRPPRRRLRSSAVLVQ